MSILKVARLGHPILRAKAKPIDPNDITSAPIQKLIDDMIETMSEYHGIGLAGPQVHEGLRVFIAGIEKKDRRTGEIEILPMAIVNPEITPVGRDLVEDWEGCLSIPDIRGKVPRNRRVRLRGFDRDGAPIDMELEDFPARVVQHEYESPQRRAVLRQDEVVRDAVVPGGVLALLGEGRGRVGNCTPR